MSSNWGLFLSQSASLNFPCLFFRSVRKWLHSWPGSFKTAAASLGPSTINGLDPIFNPVQYHEELDGIALKVADICLLHVVLEKRRLSLKKSIALLKGCRDGLEFLQEKSFATDFFNMFIEDESRAVIDTVYISKLEIETLIKTPSNLMDLKQKLRLEGDLASIAKVLAVGLVSFATTHANRVDIDILEQDLRTFKISRDINFSLRGLACLSDYVRGPVWVLGRNKSSVAMALSIGVDDVAFLWGPIAIHENMIETEKGLIIPIERSSICREDEVECHFTRQKPSHLHEKCLSAESRLLIGSRAFGVTQTASRQFKMFDKVSLMASNFRAHIPRLTLAGTIPLGMLEFANAKQRACHRVVRLAFPVHKDTSKPTLSFRYGTKSVVSNCNLPRRLSLKVRPVLFLQPSHWECWSQIANINSALGAIPQPARTKVLHGVQLLGETGVGDDATLRAWWPHGQIDWAYQVDEEWVHIAKDTHLTSTWAVGSMDKRGMDGLIDTLQRYGVP